MTNVDYEIRAFMYLTESEEEICVENVVDIKLTNGTLLKGAEVEDIGINYIEIIYNGYIDGRLMIDYDQIESIEIVER